MTKIRLGIVDDEPDWIKIIEKILSTEEDFVIVGSAYNYNDAINLIKNLDFDLIIMDMNFCTSEYNGSHITAEILEFKKDLKIIVMSAFEDEQTILLAFRAGAISFILKDNLKDLPQKMREIFRKKTPLEILVKEYNRDQEKFQINGLNKFQKEIFVLLCENKSYNEIAKTLNTTFGTVRTELHRIYKKLNVKNKKEALRSFASKGILK